MDEQDFFTPQMMDDIINDLDENQMNFFIVSKKSYIYANLLKLNVDPENFSGLAEDVPDSDHKSRTIILKDLEDLKYISEKLA